MATSICLVLKGYLRFLSWTSSRGLVDNLGCLTEHLLKFCFRHNSQMKLYTCKITETTTIIPLRLIYGCVSLLN